MSSLKFLRMNNINILIIGNFNTTSVYVMYDQLKPILWGNIDTLAVTENKVDVNFTFLGIQNILLSKHYERGRKRHRGRIT